ncbi:DUF1499 domain-containing protein [Profundibacter amoris]|uniref:DUF1499 domain-containing protein n=1 Tax=Profundibacter amoris TaxID=2171755 RepID=A0A347ULN8_9RHOB|nr:DUF1499 domain-containing protein [Profundibacter amoris]AXX99766.1 DUF1499 domain-containing protein [Profundibacter amoris]
MIRKTAINTAWLLLMVALSGLVYIRLAPDDVALVHVAPPSGATPDSPVIGQGSALFVADFNADPEQMWQMLQQVIQSTPRTKYLAGSVKEGMITFVTRSLVFGFPDYTTITVTQNEQGSRVTLFGRLRYGRSDFGVNAKRLRGWVKTLEALDQAG